MPKSALVLGGTLFFGKRLVETLLAQDYHVTLVTRGKRADPFGDRVDRRHADRSDPAQLEGALGEQDRWDVVFDQIGYSPDDASLLTRLVQGRTEKLVFMSSGAVYDPQASALTESQFDPATYPIRDGDRTAQSYGEGKRLAEAIYVQRGEFDTVAVRFPIVIGPDDYTRRLERLIDRIRKGERIDLQEEAEDRPKEFDETVSFITSRDAGAFLHWAGSDPKVSEPLNGQSGAIPFGALLELIAEETGGSIELGPKRPGEESGTFMIDRSSWLDRSRAEELGCPFECDLTEAVRELCHTSPADNRSG